MQRTFITKTTSTPENGKNKTDFQKYKETKASKIVFLKKNKDEKQNFMLLIMYFLK